MSKSDEVVELKLFDYIRIINMKEKYPDEFSGYEPFAVNRSFSNLMDTVLYANEVNKSGIDPIMNFDYYYYKLSRQKRYGKWFKKPKENIKVKNYINNIIEYYQCSKDKAQEIYRVLEKCNLLGDFDTLCDKGGKTK